jgi:hypothetical protein
MKSNFIIASGEFPNEKELKRIFSVWAKTKMQNEICLSFLINPKQSIDRTKPLSEVTIADFDFAKKISMSDMIYDLQFNRFLTWILSNTPISEKEREMRKKAYYSMFKSNIYNAIVQSRNRTVKRYGFGIYQLKDIYESRIGQDDKPYSFRPFVLCPIRPECIDRLKEIPNFESIKPELVARHRYLKKVFCNVERQAKMYRKMQEEIGEKLDVELEA